jgi:hypothetical protein
MTDNVIPFSLASRGDLIANFTTPAPPIDNRPVLSRDYKTMSFGEMTRELGYDKHGQRTQINKLRALADHAGMPLPKNPRISHGRPAVGSANIVTASLWDRGTFLAWRDFYTVPPAAVSAGRSFSVRNTLAANAAAVAGGRR